MKRTAKTRRGKTVELNTMTKVDGGWTGYVMHRKGYAVVVFVPAK